MLRRNPSWDRHIKTVKLHEPPDLPDLDEGGSEPKPVGSFEPPPAFEAAQPSSFVGPGLAPHGQTSPLSRTSATGLSLAPLGSERASTFGRGCADLRSLLHRRRSREAFSPACSPPAP